MLWPWYRYRGAREVRSVHLGAPVGSAPREETIDLLRRLRDDDPPIRLAPVTDLRGESTRWCPPKVRARAAARAWCCAWTPRRRISSRRTCTRRSCRARFHTDLSRMSDVLTDAQADEWMRRHYDAFIATIEGWGWDTKDRVLLAADGWRVAWGARKDE